MIQEQGQEMGTGSLSRPGWVRLALQITKSLAPSPRCESRTEKLARVFQPALFMMLRNGRHLQTNTDYSLYDVMVVLNGSVLIFLIPLGKISGSSLSEQQQNVLKMKPAPLAKFATDEGYIVHVKAKQAAVLPPGHVMIFLNLDKGEAVYGMRWHLTPSGHNAPQALKFLNSQLQESPDLRHGSYGVVRDYLNTVVLGR